MSTEDSCYGVVEGETLEQGDLIKQCPIFVPDYPPTLLEHLSISEIEEYSEIEGEWQTYNIIVMSQSCDLENGKLKMVAICPYWSLEQFGSMGKEFTLPKTLEEIKRGNRPSYHMLDACNLDEMKQGEQIVDFRTIYSVPYSFLRKFASSQGKRLRLLSPYKEDFSQAFGKFFMRIARPKSIRAFR